MKKIALIAVLAIAAPAFAWNGYVDSQDYVAGFHGTPFTGAWTVKGGTWNEATGVNDNTTWMASQAGNFLDAGTAVDYHGFYSDGVGQNYYTDFDFTAGSAITLQDYVLRVLNQRSTSSSYSAVIRMYASVNGGPLTAVDTQGRYGATYLTTDPTWGSAFLMPNGYEAQYTADLSALGIQAGDAVKLQWKYINDGMESKKLGFGIKLNDNAVPEPATMSLLALGGLALIRRRK